MKTNIEAENSTGVVELAPNYKIPLFLIIGACGFWVISPWLGGVIAILGLFLTIQTVLVRVQFTTEAFNVLHSGKIIRSFPYSEWLNWEIFWSPVPILFYFKEVKSIHFLPIIFDSKVLADCLQKYYPR